MSLAKTVVSAGFLIQQETVLVLFPGAVVRYSDELS